MSKKYTFSLTDEDVFYIENESKKRGVPVISIIRERYERGIKELEFSSKIEKLESEILILKQEQNDFQNNISEALALIMKKSSFTEDYVRLEITHRPSLQEQEKYKMTLASLEKRADASSNDFKNLFLKNK